MSPALPIFTPSLLSRGLAVSLSGLWIFLPLVLLFHLPVIALRIGELFLPGTGSIVFSLNFIWVLTNLFATPLATAAVVVGVFHRLRGQPTSIGRCLAKVAGRFWLLLGLTFLLAIAVLLTLGLCLLPGIFMACALFVAIPVLMAEEISIRGALERSWELTRDHRVTIFLVLLTIHLSRGLLTRGVHSQSNLFGRIPHPGGSLLMMICLLGIDVLAGTFLAVVTGVTYHDLRLAKDDLGEDDLVAIFA